MIGSSTVVVPFLRAFPRSRLREEKTAAGLAGLDPSEHGPADHGIHQGKNRRNRLKVLFHLCEDPTPSRGDSAYRPVLSLIMFSLDWSRSTLCSPLLARGFSYIDGRTWGW
jgi:hypothetical protein